MQYITSLIASTLRGRKGSHAMIRPHQPEQLLELYDMEGCPFCRPVREYLTELNLDVLIHPCPKQSARNREKLTALGGKQQMPYLFDPNTGTGMYEMRDIIVYLKDQYDTRANKNQFKPNVTTSSLASITRAMSGILYRPSLPAAEPLELFSYEANPQSRIVRERLTEMEISYVLRNTGQQQEIKAEQPEQPELTKLMGASIQNLLPTKPNSKRQELHQRSGSTKIPYLYDPNTEQGTFEAKGILLYLKNTYSNDNEYLAQP